MSTPATFKQSDVERALRAFAAVGKEIAGVEFKPDGSFRVLTPRGAEQEASDPFAEWEREHGRDRAA